MTKKRVFEIAKELNVSNKDILETLEKSNISVKNHFSTIDDVTHDLLKNKFHKTEAKKPEVKKTEVKKSEPHKTETKQPELKKPETKQPELKKTEVKQQEAKKIEVKQPVKEHKNLELKTESKPEVKESQVKPQETKPAAPAQPKPQAPAESGKVQQQDSKQNNPATGQQRPPARPPARPAMRNDQGDQANRPRPQYNNNSQGGQRPPYNNNGQGGQRPPYNNNNTQGGQRPAYNNNQGQDGQQRAPYNSQSGQRPPYNNNQGQGGQRPPYNNNQGQGGQRPPYNNNGQGGQRPPYNNNGQGGQRPPYNNQQGGPRPYNNQQGGQRPPYNNQGGQRPPYNNQGGQRSESTPIVPAADAFTPAKPSHSKNKFTNNNNKGKSDFSHDKNKHNKNESFQHRNNNRRPAGRSNDNQQPKPVIKRPESIMVGDFITVKELASKIKCEPSEIIKKLFLLGTMVTINQDIDFDTATLVAVDFGVEVLELPPEQDPTEVPEVEDDPTKRVLRPPVVTVMGHVDHGKTSLLDAIRKANVTAREAGGITQHIGAYQVTINNKKIVFLDTPGHEAFTSMRARGAKVTDIAILVVAADDGVMPQTIEAINHAKSAEVPIIVAINKIDKENANLERIKQQLSEHGLIPEDWGGETIMVPVSAKQKIGLSDLLEMILLVAEMQELKANPTIPAIGTIIEAQLDKGRGAVATVLVQKGTLEIGDTIVAGTAFGKVRAMINDRGEKVKKALPSTPVEVLGLNDVPQAGDILQATEERIARSIAEKRIAKKRVEDMQQGQKVSLDDLFKQIQEGKVKDLNILVKADVQGTIEALKQSLSNIRNEEVKVVIVHSGVGAITESDVMLASASNALIIGFNVRPDANARKVAEAEKVDLRLYRVIYDAINDVEAAIKGMLAPKFEEQIIGKVEIRKVMIINKVPIAGCYVLEGKITNNSLVRLIRDGIVILEGKLDTLKRFKDDVKEVATGYECGLTLENYRDVRENDILEVYKMQEVEA